MIARATPLPHPAHPPRTPALVGNKVPLPYRFHLTGGRTLTGHLHKSPTTRLADHLSTLKGFISVTGARCEATGSRFPYLLLNQDHVLFVEEVRAEEEASAAPGGARDVQR